MEEYEGAGLTSDQPTCRKSTRKTFKPLSSLDQPRLAPSGDVHEGRKATAWYAGSRQLQLGKARSHVRGTCLSTQTKVSISASCTMVLPILSTSATTSYTISSLCLPSTLHSRLFSRVHDQYTLPVPKVPSLIPLERRPKMHCIYQSHPSNPHTCSHLSPLNHNFPLPPSSQLNRLRYNSPPQSLNRFAACSGVMSRCGSAIISYPTRNLRTVAERSSGG